MSEDEVPRSWRQAAISGVLSAALGIAINLATDLKTSGWAWLAVGILVVTSIAATVTTGSIRRRRRESEGEPDDTAIRGDTVGNTGINLGAISKAGRDVAGRDIVYHQQPLMRSIVVLSVVIWLATAGGLVVGANLHSDKSAGAGANGPSRTEEANTPGSLSIAVATRNYYPESGVLPTLPPPPVGDTKDFCDLWADWAKTVHAAPTSPLLVLTTIAGVSSPITILDIRPIIYRKYGVGARNLLPCEYNAGGFVGTTAYIDLDHPSAPIQVDIGVGTEHTTLPPGRFAVDPKNAESMYMYLQGSTDTVYEYGIQMKIVENSVERTQIFGSPNDPLRMAFLSDQSSDRYFDWDYAGSRWVPASR
jgi:hypothetical protein